MKKLLLLVALAIGIVNAKAQTINDIFLLQILFGKKGHRLLQLY